MMSPSKITFTVGEAVPWRAAPCGVAQIAELRRTRVRLCYPTKKGTIRFALIHAQELANRIRKEPLLLAIQNPFNRGIMRRSKEFLLNPPPPEQFAIQSE